MSGGPKISHHQDRAIAALLIAPTIAEAAQAAGVNVRTLERWLSESEDFQAAYREARRRVLDGTVAELQKAGTDAVAALKRNLTCGKPPTEVRAAVAILTLGMRGTELMDVEARLDELEGMVKADDGTQV